MSRVTVEFFGLARARAGQAEATVDAATLGEALAQACPWLVQEGRLAAGWLASLDGERFLGHLGEALPDGARVLVLQADAGG